MSLSKHFIYHFPLDLEIIIIPRVRKRFVMNFNFLQECFLLFSHQKYHQSSKLSSFIQLLILKICIALEIIALNSQRYPYQV